MPDLIGQSLGRYHVLEQLGEGGMAIVYKAFDTRLEREVAVKVIRMERLAPEIAEKTFKRFDREAKALAKLNHPNIMRIIDYGEHEGYPYLVMEYLPGGTLKKHTQSAQLIPWEQSVEILIPVAEALDYAHKKNIIHRDVKPANILLNETGQPLLTDFGIAKIMEEDVTMDLTGTSVGIGTPEYMAPEQGLGKPADARTDIYSLGIVFYELITGRKPYRADTPMAVMLKKATEPLPRPSAFVPNLPKKVEQFLLKALAKDPENRYASMAEFILALEKLKTETAPAKIERKPRPKKEKKTPVARPEARERRKLPWGWIGTGAAVILIMILLVSGVFGGRQPNTETPALQPATTSEETSTTSTHTVSPPTKAPTSIPTLVPTPIPFLPESQEITFENLDQLTLMAEWGTPSGTGWSSQIKYSPDGSLIAWLDSHWDSNDNIRFLDAETLEEKYLLEIDGSVSRFVISPDSQSVAVAVSEGEYYQPEVPIYIYQIDDGSQLASFEGHDEFLRDLVYSPDGSKVISGANDGVVHVWDVERKVLDMTLDQTGTPIASLAVSPDNNTLAALESFGGGWGKSNGSWVQSDEIVEIRLWDLNTGETTNVLKSTGDISHIEFSPDGATLTDSYRIWNVASGKATKAVRQNSEGTPYLFHKSDGTLLSLENGYDWRRARTDYDLELWDAVSNQRLLTITPPSRVSGFDISPDQKYLVTAQTGGVLVWQLDDGKLKSSVDWEAQESISAYAFSPNNEQIALGLGLGENSISIRNLKENETVYTFDEVTDEVNSVSYSPDGNFLAAASLDETIRVWSMDDGTLLQTLEANTDAIKFSPDSQYFASFSTEYPIIIKIWRVDDWELIQTISLSEYGYRRGFDFINLDEFVFIQSDEIRFWRVGENESYREIPFGEDANRPGISDDKLLLVYYSYNAEELVWMNLGSGSVTRRASWDLDYYGNLALSSDNRMLIAENTIMQDGGDSYDLSEVIRGDYYLEAFSPDDKYLVAYSEGSLLLYGIPAQ
jgi:serine/threonine protein kinase